MTGFERTLTAWRNIISRHDGTTIKLDRSALVPLIEAAEQLRDEHRSMARAIRRTLATDVLDRADLTAALPAVSHEDHPQ